MSGLKSAPADRQTFGTKPPSSPFAKGGKRGLGTIGQASLVICCLMLPGQASAESTKRETQEQVQADYARLAGKWHRADGGYLLELKDVDPDGQLTASYFNPKPINVSKAEWRRMGDRLQVFVELRDVNYPGSTYLLIHSPENDRLEGYYHQAALGQNFDVVFIRSK